MLHSSENQLNPSSFKNNASTELLNTLTYKNYGTIQSAESVHLSKTNVLALCTNKCLCLLNFNFDWPSALNHASASKYFYQADKNQRQEQRQTSSMMVNVDAWIQDLHESKNESLFLNVIKSYPKSELYLKFSKQFFKLEEFCLKNKSRKSFHQQIIENVSKSKNKKPRIEPNAECSHSSSDANNLSLSDLVDESDEQFSLHKSFYNETLIYDSFFHEYLSYLNPENNQTPGRQTKELYHQEKSIFEGYKYCKWNFNAKLNLLFTITCCNQMILFDMTKISKTSNNNLSLRHLNDDHNDNEQDELKQSTKIFDAKTKSKLINLTDYYLRKYRTNFLNQNGNLHEYLRNLSSITPISCFWTEKVYKLDEAIEFECLFVLFKSNQIAMFMVYLSSEKELQIELYDLISINEIGREQNDCEFENELINTDLGPGSENLITCVRYFPCEDSAETYFGILILGYSNGRVLLQNFDIEKAKIAQRIKNKQHLHNETNTNSPNQNCFRLKNVGEFGPIQSVDLFSLDAKLNSKFMALIQTENTLKFATIIHEKSRFSQPEKSDAVKIIHIKESDFFKCENSSFMFRNYLTKNYFKLSEYSLVNSSAIDSLPGVLVYQFLLTYENSFVEHLTVKIDSKNMRFLDEAPRHLINNSNHIKLNLHSGSPKSLLTKEDFVFKTTKKILFSQNKCLLYQIFDFSKSNLVYKKPPQLQINIYKIQNTAQNCEILKNYFDKSLASVSREILIYSDLLWIFKREIFLNNEQFLSLNVFNSLYESIKKASSLNALNRDEEEEEDAKNLLFLKQVRLLVVYLSSYFETMTIFEGSSFKIKEEYEDLGEDLDDQIEQEISKSDSETSDTEKSASCKPDSNSNLKIQPMQSDPIIKSFSYYKSVFRELSLNIFKFFSLDLLCTAYKIGHENLTDQEKLLVLVHGKFSLRKNLFSALDLNRLNEKYTLNLKSVNCIEKWISNFEIDSIKSEQSNRAESKLRCDLCDSKFRIDSSPNLENVECESGHLMDRCQKTLLPLNSFKFEKCTLCNCKWNSSIKPDHYPHFKYLSNSKNKMNLCLFCN